MAVAEGVFKIIDQASRPMKTITQNGSKMVASLTQAGKALDDIDSPKVTTSLKNTTKNIKDLDRATETTAKGVKRNTSAMGNDFQRMRDKGVKSIEELTVMLKRFEKERATAQIDVDITKAEAKIRIIKQQIRSVSTAQARTELEQLGVGVKDLTESLVGGGGGGGPGGASRGLAGGFGRVAGSVGLMGLAIGAALPAIVALVGAISALIGSLGAAVGGAGVLGAGALGAFVLGIGLIVSVAKPALTQLKELKKAQDDYNKSVQQYGDKSAQAIAKHKALMDAQSKAPGAASVLQNAQVLGGRWKGLTGPARNDFFGILNAGLRTANSLLPTFGEVANRVLRSSRMAVEDFLKPFRGAEWRAIFRTLGDTWARSIGPLARGFGQLALFFGRIARAANPLVVQMFQSLERGMAGWARGAADGAKVQRVISSLVDHTKEWWRFAKAAVHLMATFFGSGAQQGKSMLSGITDQLNKWSGWIENNPDKMQAFFDRTIDAAGKLVHALGQIASTLAQISDALLPVLNAVSDIVNLTGGSGLLGPLAILGGGKFLAGKMGGRGGGKGGAGGAGGGAKGGGGGGGGVAGGVRGLGRVGGLAGVAGVIGGTMLGNAVGGKTGSFISGAATGAGVGAMVGGPWGAAIGGIGGGVLSLLLGGGGGDGVHGPGSKAEKNVARWAQMTGGSREAYTRQVAHLQGLLAGPRYSGAPGSGLTGRARGRVRQELKLMAPLGQQFGQADAAGALQNVQGAYDLRRSRGDLKGARLGITGDVAYEMKRLGPEGKTALRQATAQWAEQLSHGTESQRRIARSLTGYIVGQYDHMGKRIRTINEAIGASSKTKWEDIRKALAGSAERALQAVTRSFTAMQEQAIGKLIAMGWTRGEAKAMTRADEATNRAAAAPTRTGAIRAAVSGATGTAVTSGGAGAYAKPMGDAWGADAHSRKAANGGSTAVGGSLMGAKPGLGVYATDAASYGLRVSSGLRPGSITSAGNVSYHSSGDAIDLAGTPQQMMAFAQHAVTAYGPHLEELIYSPLGYSIKNGSRTAAYAVADHYDHVHMADTAPTGAAVVGNGGLPTGNAGQISITAPWSGLGGLPGAMANASMSAMAKGLQGKVNDALGGGSGGGSWAAQVAAAGLPSVFNAIIGAESGGNPGATNASGATGLTQIMWPLHRGIVPGATSQQALMNPSINLAAAKVLYDQSGLAPWVSSRPVWGRQGDGPGVVPEWGGWHAQGGVVTANKPTLIGIGEGGRTEKATIVPDNGRGNLNSGHVSIHIEKIVNHEEGDIEKILDRELSKVARKIHAGNADEMG